jgi:hypothetical protein
MAGTEAGGRKKGPPKFSRKIQTSTVKSAERVDRGQEATKRDLRSIGRQLGFAAESANADPNKMTSWLNLKKPHHTADAVCAIWHSFNLTQSEKTIQTCTKTVCMRGLEIDKW